MKELKKILIILIIITIPFMFYSVDAVNFWHKAQEFIDDGLNANGGMLTNQNGLLISKLQDAAKTEFEVVIDFAWGIGLLVVIAGGIILGIKYMLVLPQEKSRIKQATTPYVIGVIIIFGALTIWKLLITILDGLL